MSTSCQRKEHFSRKPWISHILSGEITPVLPPCACTALFSLRVLSNSWTLLCSWHQLCELIVIIIILILWIKKLRPRDTYLFQETNIQKKIILLKVPNHILKYHWLALSRYTLTLCDLAVLQLETIPLSKAQCHLCMEQHRKQSTGSTTSWLDYLEFQFQGQFVTGTLRNSLEN